MSNISKSKLQEILDFYLSNGELKTLKRYNLKEPSLRRYLRKAKGEGVEPSNINTSLRKIIETYSEAELKAIAEGGRFMPGIAKVPVIDFDGVHIRVGHMTDTHIGSAYSDKDRIYQAFEEFRKAKVDFITHSGDVSEGMSNRPGHIYELEHLGYTAQRDACTDILGQWSDTDAYMISGNHDRWFMKSSGADIVEAIDRQLDNWHFIGHDEGDISLGGKATIKLWHGEDGNSYALSYRIQKILESLSGGEKPSVLIAGHTHKYVNIFERNVYAMSVGTLERQTPWMRGKRIAAHVGFAIGDYWINESGVSKMSLTWHPYYT